MGQKFLLSRKQILVDLVDTDEKEFVKFLLETTVLENLDAL